MSAPRGERIMPLGIGSKLTLAFAALAAVTLLVVVLALLAGRNATDDINLTEEVRGPAWIASEQAQASLLKMQLHVRGYLVLSDPLDVEQYHGAQREFEKSLASLQAMSSNRPEVNEAKWVAELTRTYERWAKLPQQLFELHDNPLKNRPALRIARVDLQELRVRILDEVDVMIGLQKARESSSRNRGPMADLLAFQTSFDAMATNLMAYATSGELNFKLAYGPQLATNATIWNALWTKRSAFSAAQRTRLDAIARDRAQVADLALQIVSILNGEHAYEDLYLYRTEVAPQAEAMIGLLAKVTSRQQAQLKSELARARQRLANARAQTMVGGLAAVALGFAMAFVFRRNIVGPVQRLTAVAGRVADGDLSARAAVESKDEIGVLATSINTMTQRLAQTIAHLETVFADAERAKDAAVVADRAKSSFLATMSHELRTPLNGILGFAQILRRDKPLTERQARGLKIIDESGQHLLTLINDILDLARIDAAKLELFPTEINLSAFLHVLSDVVRVKAEEKSLLFSYEPAPGLPAAVRVDEKRLRQVLLNLLSNAVKFTDSGEVSLCVQALEPQDKREHGGADSISRLRFEVRDSGIGMTEAQLARLFQPFEQVADVNRREGGTGLGLAISRQLVRLMGGDIQVRSRPGHGSVFSFELDLPVAHGQIAASTGRGSPVGYEGLRKKVLVVDDVAQNRAMLLDALSMLGFQVADASNGAECLDVAARVSPDLIIMDVMMPVMDGYEATQRVRLLPGLADVPIVATSASATQEVEARCRAAGANAFVSKPIDQGLLQLTIEPLMGIHWIYPQAEPQASNIADVGDADPVLPPPEDMVELGRLSRTGNMRAIRGWADQLKAFDAKYAPFATRLAALADECQSEAIVALVERCSTERKEG
jgi:signal transduction histidine kinase/DNA-binding NarL/FixJ family response regulator